MNRPTADRAKVERDFGTRVADANKGCRSTSDGHGVRMKARLYAKHAASSALTLKTMADRNADRISHSINAELTAATRS